MRAGVDLHAEELPLVHLQHCLGSQTPGVPRTLRRGGDLVDGNAGNVKRLQLVGESRGSREAVEHHHAEQVVGGAVEDGVGADRGREPAARGMPAEDERLRQHAFVAGSVGADVQFGPVAEEHRGGGIPVERRAVVGGCHHDAVGLLCQRLSQGRVRQVQRHSESATTTVLQPDQAVGLHRAVGLGREVPACEGADPVVPGRNEQRRGPGAHPGHPVGQRRLHVAVHAVWPGVDRRRRGQTEERPDGVDHVFEHGVQRREIVGERSGQAHRSGAARDDLLVRGGVQPVLRCLRGSTDIEIIDPAGAQVVDGRGAAGRGEPGDQL